MNLDLWILAAVGIFAVIGFFTGAIQQFSHWIGIAAAYFCAQPLAALVAPALAARMGWPPALAAVGLSAVAMPVILIIATKIARWILNAIIPGDQRNRPDRIAGIFLGAGKAGLIAWVMLAAVLAFEEPLVKSLPGAKAALNASWAAGFTRKHSLFDAALPPALAKFRAVAALRDDPAQAQALLNDPELRSLLSDPVLKQALEKGDAASLLENPEVKRMLADPEMVKKIEAMSADLE
ncbi:MAG TPA: CvpA family protein [Elusimicrobiales bacterium]|nr:CvpA family protein [Elusimicrobiales bacterium]